MRKKYLIQIILLIITFFILTSCTNADYEAKSRIKELIGVDIPDDAEILFHFKEKEDFFPVPGRRLQYTVFYFEDEPVDFLLVNNFQSEKSDALEQWFDALYSAWIKQMDVNIPNEYKANWDSEYFWLDIELGKGLYVIYFVETHHMIVYITAY